MEERQVAKAHKLVINNRKTSMVTGVLDVLLVWALCRSRVFTAAGVWPSGATPAEKGASEQ